MVFCTILSPMIPRSSFLRCAVFAAVILTLSPALPAQEPSALGESTPLASPIQSLGPTDIQRSELQHAVGTRDYVTAEKLLLSAINKDPHSPRAAKLLAYAGSVYFLNADYLNAAIAWKKSEDDKQRPPIAVSKESSVCARNRLRALSIKQSRAGPGDFRADDEDFERRKAAYQAFVEKVR